MLPFLDLFGASQTSRWSGAESRWAWLAVWYRRSSGRQPCHRARARLAAWLAVWYRRKPGRQPAVACKPLERISVLAGKTLHRRHIRFCGQRIPLKAVNRSKTSRWSGAESRWAWLAVWYRRSSGRQPCHRARARLAAWLAVWYRRKPGRQPAVACKPLERISVLAGKTLHRRHIRFCGQRIPLKAVNRSKTSRWSRAESRWAWLVVKLI